MKKLFKITTPVWYNSITAIVREIKRMRKLEQDFAIIRCDLILKKSILVKKIYITTVVKIPFNCTFPKLYLVFKALY